MNRVDFYEENGICVIKPMGEMIFFFLEEVSKFVKNKIKHNYCKFVFELAEVPWIDSIGLGLFAMTVKAAILNQTKVCIVNPSENIVKLLKMSNLLDFINICGSMDEAVGFFSA